ncbi:hypothetical protein BKA57DRAFT_503765 [Linnemannia elongata]|nr:hypothetical protein BKA57DRAFT_503765 [Linnemannia elongata]
MKYNFLDIPELVAHLSSYLSPADPSPASSSTAPGKKTLLSFLWRSFDASARSWGYTLRQITGPRPRPPPPPPAAINVATGSTNTPTFTASSDGPLDLRQCSGPSNGTQRQHSGANSTHVRHLYSMQPFSSDSHDLGAHHLPNPRPLDLQSAEEAAFASLLGLPWFPERSSLALSVRKTTSRGSLKLGNSGHLLSRPSQSQPCLIPLGEQLARMWITSHGQSNFFNPAIPFFSAGLLCNSSTIGCLRYGPNDGTTDEVNVQGHIKLARVRFYWRALSVSF